jgi:hypothetical protein
MLRRTLLFGIAAAPLGAGGARGQKPGPAPSAGGKPAPPGAGPPSTGGDPGARPGSALRLRRFEIMDPHGFERPIPAASLLAPADWRLEGAVAWGYPACITDLVAAHVRIASPDGRHALELLPLHAWTWSEDPLMVQTMRQSQSMRQGCPVAPPMSAAEAVRQIYLPRFRPGAQVVGIQRDAAAAQAAREQMAPQLAARGPQAALRTDAARLRLAHGGVEEWLACAVATVSYPVLSASAAAQGGMAYTRQHDSGVQGAYAFRAPQGGLEEAEPLLGAMLASIRLNPAWQTAVNHVTAAILRAQIIGAAERARIWRDAMNEIGEMRMRSWQSARESQDRVSRAFSQYIRGVQTMVNPRTGAPVEVPSGYSHVWMNGAGEYVLSNDPSFNPGPSHGGAWEALRRP